MKLTRQNLLRVLSHNLPACESNSTIYLTLHPDQEHIPPMQSLGADNEQDYQWILQNENSCRAADLLADWMDLTEKRIAALEVEVHENELWSKSPEEDGA